MVYAIVDVIKHVTCHLMRLNTQGWQWIPITHESYHVICFFFFEKEDDPRVNKDICNLIEDVLDQ